MINTYNAPVVMHLKFKNSLSKAELQDLKKVSTIALINALLEAHIPEDSLTFINNDVLLQGKKIYGGERIVKTLFMKKTLF